MIFKITNITKWPDLKVCIIDGMLVRGKILTGSTVTLVQGDLELPLKVTGIVLPSHTGALTLNVDIDQAAVEAMKVGDHLASA